MPPLQKFLLPRPPLCPPQIYILPVASIPATDYSALLPPETRLPRYIAPAPVLAAAPQHIPPPTTTNALKYGGLSKSAFYRKRRQEAESKPVSRRVRPYTCKLYGQAKNVSTGHKQRQGYVYCPASGVQFNQWCVEIDAKKKKKSSD